MIYPSISLINNLSRLKSVDKKASILLTWQCCCVTWYFSGKCKYKKCTI